MNGFHLEKRSPALVIILGIFTCGIYLFFWYYKIYQELTALGGRTPTTNEYLFDLLLVIVTCGIWGIYVDYRISLQLTEIQKKRGMRPSDTATIVVILDVAAYVSGFLTYFVTSAIQQDELNRTIDDAQGAGQQAAGATTVPAPPGVPGAAAQNEDRTAQKNPYG